MTTLPGVAGQIETVIGLELTVLLLRRRGGTQITIPVRPKGSILAEIIGADATRKLALAIGAGKLNLPCGEMRGARARRSQAKRMLLSGASLQQVALACDLHSRTVSNYRAELDAAAGDRQMKLPL